MIVLTRLNGHSIIVNSDLIKYAEASPDTVLTLITGEKLIVLESCEDVQERCMEYRAEGLRRAWPEACVPFAGAAAISVGAQAGSHATHQDNS